MKPITRALGSIAILALAGLTGSAEAADDTIKIGLEIPLSPPGDPAAGQLIRRGAELAVIYVNTVMKGVNGGKMIELVVQDCQGKTDVGVAAYRKLATEDKVIG
ncbi:MAG TPA: ABC transporter substrate-binding protein, partial [Stellaceae bacterium]|nr:ABC transporter substrate-binding protein [Stellaceae bacterium]